MKVVLAGSSGRLGGEVLKVLEEKRVQVAPLSRSEIADSRAFARHCEEPVVILDVTLPEGTAALCSSILALNSTRTVRGLVVGSTGHTPGQLELIYEVSQRIPVCVSSNFSRGIYLFEQILKAKTESGKTVTDLARELGFDLALWESHHDQKKDIPSGTAKTLAEAASIPMERIASSRVGRVVGEHILQFAGDSEELRLQHTAHTRRLFALGAVDLLEKVFSSHQDPGIYDRTQFQ